jgi:hypothetical protein
MSVAPAKITKPIWAAAESLGRCNPLGSAV